MILKKLALTISVIKKQWEDAAAAAAALYARVCSEIVMGVGIDEWSLILQYVSDPEDKWACYHACEMWKWLLERTKENWQLELVLPILAPHLKQTRNQPFVFRNCLPLWKARLISKPWNKAIHKFAEKVNHERKLATLHMQHPGFVYYFSQTDELDEFMNRFADTADTVNPFIGRAAEFLPKYIYLAANIAEESYTNYFQRMLQFLLIFGKHLHHIGFGDQHGYRRIRNYFEGVQQGLLSTPNLISLKFTGRNRFEDADIAVRFLDAEFPERSPDITAEQTREYFNQNPLPQLNHLKNIGFTKDVGTFEELILEKYGPQLKSFYSTAPQELKEDHFRSFRSLQEISFQNLRWNDPFERLSFIQSPLKSIQVSFQALATQEQQLRWWHVDRFLKAVKHLPLQALEFITDNVIITEYGTINKEELNLPSVRYVAFYGQQSMVVSFNFLQCFPNLRYLDVAYWARTPTQSRAPYYIPETVKLHRFLYEEEKYKKIYRFSNVWELLPSLQRIDACWSWRSGSARNSEIYRSFTREEYQKFQKKETTPH